MSHKKGEHAWIMSLESASTSSLVLAGPKMAKLANVAIDALHQKCLRPFGWNNFDGYDIIPDMLTTFWLETACLRPSGRNKIKLTTFGSNVKVCILVDLVHILTKV